MGKFDLSKFKKVRTGAKHTVLKHPDGHEITVFHKQLSPPVRKELDSLKMYDGGKVPSVPATDEDTSNAFKRAFKTPEPKSAPQESPESKYEAIRKQNRANFGYAEGGEVKPAPQPVIADQDKRKQAQDSMRKAFGFAAGGNVEGMSGVDEVPMEPMEAQYAMENFDAREAAKQVPSAQIDQEASAPIAPVDSSHAHLAEAIKNLSTKFVGSAPEVVPAQTVNQGQHTQPVADMQSQQGISQPAQPLAPAASVPDQQPHGSMVQQNQQDINLENRAQAAMGQNTAASQEQNAQAYGAEAQGMQDLHKKYEEIGNQIHQKYEDLSAQVEKGHIDPSQWWNNKSTGSQIATAIGMMFAGAGLGASGHPELASKAIDDAINRDIDAQKSDLSNKQSLLGKYMEMYNNLPQAEAAARLTMHAATEGLVNQHAAKLNSQNAPMVATLFAADNRKKGLQQVEGLAKSQALKGMYDEMNGAGSGKPKSNSEASFVEDMNRKRLLLPDQGKVMESRYLPGVGVASREIPDKVREELITRKDLSEKIAELENFARKNSGTLFDRKIVNQGKALAANVQDAYRRGNQQGVFKPSEAEFVNKSINEDPTAYFSKYRNIPGYQTARKLNEDTVKLYQKSYGVKPFQEEQSGNQNQAAMEWLKANSNDPRAEAVRKKLGM